MRNLKSVCVTGLLLSILCLYGMKKLPRDYKNFNEWAHVCKDQKLQVSAGHYYTALNKEIFEKTFHEFIDASNKSSLGKKANWLNRQGLDSTYFDPDTSRVKERDGSDMFKKLSIRDNVFVQKLVLQEDAEIAVVTDLHAKVSFLLRFLEDPEVKKHLDPQDPFKIKSKNFYMVFLGDYSDRGRYGLEVLYTLMRFKIKNPEHVILLRGNHEFYGINEFYKEGGLLQEFISKLGATKDDFVKQIITMYDLMPSALYVGRKDSKGVANYAMLSHSGDVMYLVSKEDQKLAFNQDKICYNPQRFLALGEQYEKIDLLEQYAQMLCRCNSALQIGFARDYVRNKLGSKIKAEGVIFVSRDFIVDGGKDRVKLEHKRGWLVGRPLLQDYLNAVNTNRYQVKVMLRGHQHHGKMVKQVKKHGGIYGSWLSDNQQWDGKNAISLKDASFDKEGNSLWTFYSSTVVSLESPLVKNYIPVYVILKIKRDFKDWQLEPYRL